MIMAVMMVEEEDDDDDSNVDFTMDYIT